MKPNSDPNQAKRLLERLEDIAHSLERTGRGLALIGLGSVGLELERLDACSDLDFFAIVEPGSKPDYLQTLDWLAAPAPITYAFPNTADGFKYLYADGIFCEMAVFEPEELADRLNAMPKIELHVHLEGAVEAATVWEMSRRNGVPLPAASLAEWQTFFEFRDFSHFLEVYTASVYCIQTPQDFATDLNHEFHLLARQGFS